MTKLTEFKVIDYIKDDASLAEYVRLAVEDEREACAALCDAAKPTGGRMWTDEQAACFDALEHVAEHIRARSQA